jgi:hypothetical protein
MRIGQWIRDIFGDRTIFYGSEPEPTYLPCMVRQDDFRLYSENGKLGAATFSPGNINVNGHKPTRKMWKRGWAVVKPDGTLR